MKKALVVTLAVLFVFSIAATVMAAPQFSGEVLLESDITKDDTKMDNRIRLNVDSQITDAIFAHARFAVTNNVGEARGPVDADQLYVGFKFDNASIKIGRQGAWLGQGLAIDANSLESIQVSGGMDKLSAQAIVGKTTGDAEIFGADVAAKVTDKISVGASYIADNAENDVWTVNTSATLANNVNLVAEYAQNADNDAAAYYAKLTVGSLVKKNDTNYFITYKNIEADSVNSYNTIGAAQKGFRVGLNHKLADAVTLGAYQDMVEDPVGNKTDTTHVELTVNF